MSMTHGTFNNLEFGNNIWVILIMFKFTSDSCFDLLLSIGRDGKLLGFLYDNFITISNFKLKFEKSSKSPHSPTYGVNISQLLRYARTYSFQKCFILRAIRFFQ